MKFTKKSAWGVGKKRKMMADDTKAYFQEVIRGAGLFGILTRSGSEDSRDVGAEGFMDNFEDWNDLPELEQRSASRRGGALYRGALPLNTCLFPNTTAHYSESSSSFLLFSASDFVFKTLSGVFFLYCGFFNWHYFVR